LDQIYRFIIEVQLHRSYVYVVVIDRTQQWKIFVVRCKA
jgi:hypothetical protein